MKKLTFLEDIRKAKALLRSYGYVVVAGDRVQTADRNHAVALHVWEAEKERGLRAHLLEGMSAHIGRAIGEKGYFKLDEYDLTGPEVGMPRHVMRLTAKVIKPNTED